VFSTPASTARWLEHLARVLRNLEGGEAWIEADEAALRDERRRQPGAASPDGRLNGLNTISEVAAYARVSPHTVRRAIASGNLDYARAGSRNIRIADEAVLKWLALTNRVEHEPTQGG
jgi:excisionase family DNA binding protein